MSDPAAFANNWTYLKTELNWLERLLMLAVARKREAVKPVNRVARHPGDRVTSHWWQGIVSVSPRRYDEGPPPQKSPKSPRPAPSYQASLDQRIQASQVQGVWLALPEARSRLGLSLFEKNALLMALAPEVDLRYSRLYHFLQTGEENSLGTLPTTDLMLRLLCRNDAERRAARTQLCCPNSLIHRHVLRPVTATPHTLLGSYLQLAPAWSEYLLAEQPAVMPTVAAPTAPFAPKLEQVTPRSFNPLAFPEPLQTSLRALVQQSDGGEMILLVGEPGTGKLAAVGAIAQRLQTIAPMVQIDLTHHAADSWPTLFEQLTAAAYPVLLVSSAQVWLGRRPPADSGALSRWWQQRRQAAGLTLFSVRYSHTVRACWRRQFSRCLEFCLPDAEQRCLLWQQAFPNGVRAIRTSHWHRLAQLSIEGDRIAQVAQTALSFAEKPTLDQLQQALDQHGYDMQVKVKRRLG